MSRNDSGRVRVWGLAIRLVHWGLAVSVITAWLTDHGPPRLHDAMGYAALALVLMRLFHGVLGPAKNRFVRFVAGPRQTLSYTRKIMMGHEPRFLGHNPLGGWMIVALLAVIFATGITGWLFTTDRFWGVNWVLSLHAWLADILLVLIVAHIVGVVFTSVRQGKTDRGINGDRSQPRGSGSYSAPGLDADRHVSPLILSDFLGVNVRRGTTSTAASHDPVLFGAQARR